MSIQKELKSAVKEEDVNYIYRKALTLSINGEFTSITQHQIKVDGLLLHKDLSMLLEFKRDNDFTKKSEVVEVIIQVIYYLKQFEDAGISLPNICFVGDINECFYFHSNDAIKYLSLDLDWKISPSTAGKKNTELFKLLFNDENIHPFVHTLNDDFDIVSIMTEIINLNNGTVQKEHITEKNINKVFDYFTNRVIRGKKLNKKNSNELVNIFITTVLNKNENYIHTHKPNTLVTKSFGNVIVNGHIFKTFFDRYQMDFSIKEKDRLTEICDRLIEDTTRRFKGEFFTPTEWVDEAHRMIDEEFGDDWKEKYVVWDPACGTGNLTRDYKFKELYCSTINKSDLDIMNQMGYNPEATKFQFDFLNDSDDKLPAGLKKAIEEGKQIIVPMNPPYGTANSISTDVGIDRKKGIALTNINKDMLKINMGACSQQLYSQFLYAISLYENINIATFTPPLFMSGGSFKKFREYFYKKYKFLNGMLFKANHFSEVSSEWGISFTIWKTSGETTTTKLNIKDYNNISDTIEVIGNKDIYNTDHLIECSKWIRELNKNLKTLKCVQIKSALGISNSGVGKIVENGIGYMHNNANSVYHNSSFVGLYSTGFKAGHGLPISIPNFNRVTSLFTARKSVVSNWINQKDEYLAPNTEHPDYEQWNKDCLVYALFNNSSNQSSLRDIEYKGNQWDIKNEWFWMSQDHMKLLAEMERTNEVERDIKNFGGDRFVYNKLQGLYLSEDAKTILDKAIELTEASFEFRKIMIEEYPEYHLNTWDAGFYQIKKILKKYMPDELKSFRSLYKEFEDRMREGVYKFGFLK